MNTVNIHIKSTSIPQGNDIYISIVKRDDIEKPHIPKMKILVCHALVKTFDDCVYLNILIITRPAIYLYSCLPLLTQCLTISIYALHGCGYPVLLL